MTLTQKVTIIYNLTNLISYIEFTLTEQGEDVIRSFKGEFGVISVAGMYRTGKSYLINRMLLNRQKGFSVGPTVNPCTKGLWIWSKPIFGDSGKGKRLPLLLIDTEGFGALDTDSNHDIRIFTLAILLSSYFLYNSVGGNGTAASRCRTIRRRSKTCFSRRKRWATAAAGMKGISQTKTGSGIRWRKSSVCRKAMSWSACCPSVSLRKSRGRGRKKALRNGPGSTDSEKKNKAKKEKRAKILRFVYNTILFRLWNDNRIRG